METSVLRKFKLIRVKQLVAMRASSINDFILAKFCILYKVVKNSVENAAAEIAFAAMKKLEIFFTAENIRWIFSREKLYFKNA